MPHKNARRHGRVPFVASVEIAWEDSSGRPKFARAKCMDISESGLRVDAPEPIPAGTSAMLRASQIELAGPVRVKHVTRAGSRFLLGLELSEQLRNRARERFRDRPQESTGGPTTADSAPR